MEPNDVKVAVGHFLELVVNGRGSEQENVEALETALDMLAWIQNLVEPAAQEDHPEAPTHEFEKMRMLIAEQFPTFGTYHAPAQNAEQNGEAEVLVGDAVDDLASIACRLYEIAWRFQNTTDEDALGVFSRTYSNEWRSPLRALQWYIEARRDDQS